MPSEPSPFNQYTSAITTFLITVFAWSVTTNPNIPDVAKAILITMAIVLYGMLTWLDYAYRGRLEALKKERLSELRNLLEDVIRFDVRLAKFQNLRLQSSSSFAQLSPEARTWVQDEIDIISTGHNIHFELLKGASAEQTLQELEEIANRCKNFYFKAYNDLREIEATLRKNRRPDTRQDDYNTSSKLNN